MNATPGNTVTPVSGTADNQTKPTKNCIIYDQKSNFLDIQYTFNDQELCTFDEEKVDRNKWLVKEKKLMFLSE